MLQEISGGKMGPLHRSDHTCIAMIEHIATKMKKSMISALKSNDYFVSLTVDESSNFGKSYLIIYLRADVTGREAIENIFLDLVELDKSLIQCLCCCSLKNTLLTAGLDNEYLKSHLISIATDGASVMTGRESGLIAKLRKDFPSLKSIHCLACIVHCQL